jgi:hypothetical protein
MVIKPVLDAIYSNYNLSTHILMWDPEPVGPRCTNGAWFLSSPDDHCQDSTTIYLTQVQNLIAPAFAWYWRLSGDNTYRDEGDEIFSHALDTAADKGKVFGQMYRYSFNYAGWRQGWLSPERSIE